MFSKGNKASGTMGRARPALVIGLAALLIAGCVQGPRSKVQGPTANSQSTGIPNLAQVASGIWRGGQPSDAGWEWLARAGVSNVVKLDMESEGSDAKGEQLGMVVRRYPISTAEQLVPSWALIEVRDRNAAPIEQPMSWKVIDAAAAIKPGWFIHCLHGEDRTGLVVAYWELFEGTNYAAAESDMLAHGFHRELGGLWDFWERCKPHAKGAEAAKE